MTVIYVVLPLAFVLAAAALGACVWAIRCGQFEDLSTPPLRVLADDPIDQKPTNKRQHRETE